MLYVIFNNDGSINTLIVGESINQGNNGANQIFITILGRLVGSYSCVGEFVLPNGNLVELNGSAVEEPVEIGDREYDGYVITLTDAVTYLSGNLKVNVKAIDINSNVLCTYQVTLKVNPTGYEPNETTITESQYNSLLSSLNSYLLKIDGVDNHSNESIGGIKTFVDGIKADHYYTSDGYQVFNLYNGNVEQFGYSGFNLELFGHATRPAYNNQDLALYSDIPDLTGYATETWVTSQGYLTGIDDQDIITALGYTPVSPDDLQSAIDDIDIDSIKEFKINGSTTLANVHSKFGDEKFGIVRFTNVGSFYNKRFLIWTDGQQSNYYVFKIYSLDDPSKYASDIAVVGTTLIANLIGDTYKDNYGQELPLVSATPTTSLHNLYNFTSGKPFVFSSPQTYSSGYFLAKISEFGPTNIQFTFINVLTLAKWSGMVTNRSITVGDVLGYLSPYENGRIATTEDLTKLYKHQIHITNLHSTDYSDFYDIYVTYLSKRAESITKDNLYNQDEDDFGWFCEILKDISVFETVGGVFYLGGYLSSDYDGSYYKGTIHLIANAPALSTIDVYFYELDGTETVTDTVTEF